MEIRVLGHFWYRSLEEGTNFDGFESEMLKAGLRVEARSSNKDRVCEGGSAVDNAGSYNWNDRRCYAVVKIAIAEVFPFASTGKIQG